MSQYVFGFVPIFMYTFIVPRPHFFFISVVQICSIYFFSANQFRAKIYQTLLIEIKKGIESKKLFKKL